MVKRQTKQKEKILTYLKSVTNHPTAEKVYKAVSKEMPKITLATVYRNLNQMAEEGKILRLEINKEYHYDACIELHQHCICEKCGKIMDSMQRSISEEAIKNLNVKKYKAQSVSIVYSGICTDCKAKGGK